MFTRTHRKRSALLMAGRTHEMSARLSSAARTFQSGESGGAHGGERGVSAANRRGGRRVPALRPLPGPPALPLLPPLPRRGSGLRHLS